MRDIDDMLSQVMPFAPNAPEPLVLRHIREIAREFCQVAKVWREREEFEISSPTCIGIIGSDDKAIVEIESASLNDRKLDPVTVGWLNDNRPQWNDDADHPESTAIYITQLTPNTITVTPRESGTVRAMLVLQPSLTAQSLPDLLFDVHLTTIARGVASRVLITPGADFANPQLGLTLYNEFLGNRSTAKTVATKGQQGARLRTKGDWL
jgi:mRNA-degrading endonuclease toxin of MazEF toxin-antitoxin module